MPAMLTRTLSAPLVSVTPASLLDVVAQRATDQPNNLAFDVKGTRLTWSLLLEHARRTASVLEVHGAVRGAPCAIALSTSVELLSALFGAQLLGAIPVLVNPRLPAGHIVRRARALECALLVANAGLLAHDASSFGELSRCDASALLSGEPIERRAMSRIEADQVSHLQITSGTTGEPRAVTLRHRHVTAAVVSARDAIDPSPRDVMVGWLPLHHDLGLVRFVFESIYFGTATYLLEPAMAALPSWLETISRVGGTITAAPDFAYRVVGRLVNPDTVDLRTLRVATNGGEVVRHASIRAFEERFRTPGVVQPGYGLAEATLGVTCVRPTDARRIGQSGAVSCGRALKGVELRISDDAGQPVAIGQRGRILVRGPAVTDGYWNDPSSSADLVRDGWLETGDMGALDDDGELYVLGRTRAMIKRAGATIAPREIEELIDELAGVRRSAAVGIATGADALTEEVLVVVEIERTVTGATEATLRDAIVDALRTTLGVVPAAVHLVPPGTIPRTATGKTQYAELQRMAFR